MSKRTFEKEKPGIQKKMSIKDYFGDSLGQFAISLMTTLAGQLTYFYTDKAGLAAGVVATMFLVCKIADAFTGLIMGNLIDHTRPGKEKYRPWILKAGIPAGITMILLFTIPPVGETGKLVYVIIVNLLINAVFFTAISLSYGSLMVVRTNSQRERSTMGTWRAAFSYVSGMFIAVFVIPITNAMGGDANAWIKFALILSVFVFPSLLIAYATNRECTSESVDNVKEETEEMVPFGKAIRMLFRNKYWVIVLFVNTLSGVIYGIIATSGAYYCKWIFGNDNLVGITGMIGIIPTIVGFLVVTPMNRRFGAAKTLQISFGMGVISNVLLILFRNNFVAYCILGCISTFATIPLMCLGGVVSAMAIDYNEYKYGVKMIATSNSAAGFGSKVGSGIGASLIGWMLALAHYDSTLAVATQATKLAIYGFTFVVPLMMFGVMYLLISRFDLEKSLPEMKKKRKRERMLAYK